MQSVSDISKVIIIDKIDNPPEILDNIILGVSKNDNVYYQNSKDIYVRKEKDTLFLYDFYGEVLIPKYCGLQILDSEKTITGLINYPAYIYSNAAVNVMIEKTSGLELVLRSDGEVYLNNMLVPVQTNQDTEDTPTLIGKSFEEYEENYANKLKLKKPKIITNEFGTIAEFDNIQKHSLIDTCIKYNLVRFDNGDEDTRIIYEKYNPYRLEPQIKIFKNIRILEQRLNLAEKKEEYLEMKDIKIKIDKLYRLIEQNKKTIKTKTIKKPNNKIEINFNTDLVNTITQNIKPNSNSTE